MYFTLKNMNCIFRLHVLQYTTTKYPWKIKMDLKMDKNDFCFPLKIATWVIAITMLWRKHYIICNLIKREWRPSPLYIGSHAYYWTYYKWQMMIMMTKVILLALMRLWDWHLKTTCRQIFRERWIICIFVALILCSSARGSRKYE